LRPLSGEPGRGERVVRIPVHDRLNYLAAALLNRLARAGGQIDGIARMVEEERYCIDVISQINAVQAALDKIALGLLDGTPATACSGKATGRRSQTPRSTS
jgi:DNA-binding FrmR family transcriptional regulator